MSRVRDWTKGSIARNLLSLSWPLIVEYSLFMAGNVFDMIFVGRLGTVSIAAVGVSGMVVSLVMTATMGLRTASSAVVARFVGAGDEKGACHAGGQAFIIGAGFGVVMTVIGVSLAEPVLNLFALKADVVAEGTIFLRVMFAGWWSMSLWLMAFGTLQASGDPMTAMKIAIFVRCVHVVLAPFLIFGWWLFPRLGVGGAAMAQVISQILVVFLTLWVFFGGRTRLRLSWGNFRPDLRMIWRIVKIGIPASVMGLQRSFEQLVLTRLMSPFGTLAVAAHSLANRVEAMLNLPGGGLARGGAILVGQNLGAGQPQRAERSGWLAAGLVEAFMLLGSAAILLWAESVVRIFNTEPNLVELTSTFLRIAVAGFLVMGFTQPLSQAISGAGDTIPPMVISLVMVWLVQLPLAFFLPRVTELGVLGVRWAIVAGLVVGAIAYLIYFRLGRWKQKKV